MFCKDCSNITITLPPNVDQKVIRSYENIWQLKSLAKECDFCELAYNDAVLLETGLVTDDESSETELQRNMLIQTPIEIHQIHHGKCCDIFWSADPPHSLFDSAGQLSLYTGGYLSSVVVEAKSSAASIIAGRRPKQELSIAAMTRMASGWLEECRIKHVDCGHGAQRDFTSPTRVLDVSQMKDDQLAALLVHPESNFKEEYAALSYCWGDAHTILLTENSIKELTSSPFLVQKLPPTFRDAILLTRALGIRYLWIDALCIIQDSAKDWVKESARMFDVFSRAALVIQGTHGKDTQTGLFGNSRSAAKRCIPMKLLLPDGEVTECFTWPNRTRYREPLDGRAWALQEYLLAKRAVCFGSEQMQWSCRQASFDEFEFPKHSVTWLQAAMPDRTLITSYSINDSHLMVSTDNALKAFASWQAILRMYCSRRVTKPTDKFVAMSGLAQHYAEQFLDLEKDRYLAGMWLSHLPQSLLWCISYPDYGVKSVNDDQFVSPTWSWACVNQFDIFVDDLERIFCESVYATIQHAEVKLSGPDPYGQIRSAFLIIKGQFKHAVVVLNRPSDTNDLFNAEELESGSGMPIGTVHMDSFDGNSRPVQCLRITESFGLILEQENEGEQGPNLWKRAGVFEVKDKDWWQDAEMCIVTLI